MGARLLAAVSFLTLFRSSLAVRESNLAGAVGFFPVVGAGVGLFSGYVASLAAWHWNANVAAALAMLTELVVTRGLHWDGLIDTADGLAVGGREQALAVMRDPRAGGLGVAAAGVLLLLRFGVLSALPAAQLVPALVTAGAVSRWVLSAAVVIFPYARPQGLGRPFQRAGYAEVLMATALLLVLLAFLPARAWLAGLITAVVTWRLAAALASWLGGLTGDTYGFLAVAGDILALAVWSWR